MKTIRTTWILAGALLCGAFFAHAIGAPRKRPNVLMIAVDDLRPELGCYGVDAVKSPNIDRLAGQGMVFDRAYVQISVCGPCRTSLLSGLRPDSSGILTNRRMIKDERPDIVTLPHHFRKQGYRTASLGKIYHHPEDDPEAWTEPVWRPFGIGWGWRNYRLPENLAIINELYSKLPESRRETYPLGRVKGPAWEATDNADNVYPDGLTADMAIHTMGRHAGEGQPFFLAVGFYKPHLPFVCPQKYWDLYDPEKISLPANDHPPKSMPPVAFRDSDELRQYHGIPKKGEPIDDQMARRLIHGYYACVSYMDAQVGRVLAELDRLGLSEDTIVILWGDHGWHLREQGIWAKQTNFEIANRIPLIVRAPGMAAAGRRTSALVEAVDIYPTLCRLAGLPLKMHLEGASFAPLLNDPGLTWKKAAFGQQIRPVNEKHQTLGRTMRTGTFRFTQWFDRKDPGKVVATELYDHRSDSTEAVNIAGEPEHAARVAALAKRLAEGWEGARPPPTVVLLGDSIRINYQSTVREKLERRANVWSPKENGKHTLFTLQNLERWLNGRDARVVHINVGLHDLFLSSKTKRPRHSLATYEKNLRAIFTKLRELTGAEIVFALTTAVDENRQATSTTYGRVVRRNSDIDVYNAKARQIAAEFGIRVNDLNGYMKRVGADEILREDGIHLTPFGCGKLGGQVAKTIVEALAAP